MESDHERAVSVPSSRAAAEVRVGIAPSDGAPRHGAGTEAQPDWRAVIMNRGNIDWQTRLFVALKRARVSVVVGSGRRRAKSPTLPGTRVAMRTADH